MPGRRRSRTYEPTTLNLKTNLQTMPVGERPTITLEATDHPLSLEQLHGVKMARVQQIAEAALHVGHLEEDR